MLNYYPPSGGQGISLGLVRQYRCAYGAHPSGVGTPTPRSIALGSKNPRLDLLPRGASVRFVFYRSSILYLATGLILLPLRSGLCLGFWSLLARCSSPHPRSVFHFRFLVHSWLVRLRGPASVQLSLARYLPAGWHPFYACACLWSGAWVSRASRGCASFVYRIPHPISCLLACKFKCVCTRLLFRFFLLAGFFLPFPMQTDTVSPSRPRHAEVSQLRRW